MSYNLEDRAFEDIQKEFGINSFATPNQPELDLFVQKAAADEETKNATNQYEADVAEYKTNEAQEGIASLKLKNTPESSYEDANRAFEDNDREVFYDPETETITPEDPIIPNIVIPPPVTNVYTDALNNNDPTGTSTGTTRSTTWTVDGYTFTNEADFVTYMQRAHPTLGYGDTREVPYASEAGRLAARNSAGIPSAFRNNTVDPMQQLIASQRRAYNSIPGQNIYSAVEEPSVTSYTRPLSAENFGNLDNDPYQSVGENLINSFAPLPTDGSETAAPTSLNRGGSVNLNNSSMNRGIEQLPPMQQQDKLTQLFQSGFRARR